MHRLISDQLTGSSGGLAGSSALAQHSPFALLSAGSRQLSRLGLGSAFREVTMDPTRAALRRLKVGMQASIELLREVEPELLAATIANPELALVHDLVHKAQLEGSEAATPAAILSMTRSCLARRSWS